ncbi:MAG: MFS transporter [Neomegalonema sp.]|nr:MFS transporter [Neomegalonema sp.]
MTAGIVMSGYFVGFVLGSFTCPGLISRVGHIRAFSALATLASAAAVLHVLSVDPIAWTVLRVLTGYCIAGLYMVLESWMNGRADNKSRGGLLATYFLVNLGAVALGQQLLRADDPASYELFVIASVLVSLAIVPISLTRSEAPAPVRSPSLSLSTLVAISPFALVGSVMAGIANGAFWGMAPRYGVELGLSNATIALVMTTVIIGGAAFQFPIGKLSDRFDRRLVMNAANLVLAGIGLAIAQIGLSDNPLALALGAVFGGLLLTQYSLCIAHANDYVADGDFVQLASGLLLTFGAAAAIGPALAAAMMASFGPAALFWLIAAASLASALYGAWRMTRRTSPTFEESGDFVPVPAMLSSSVLAPSEEAFEGLDTGPEIEILDLPSQQEEEVEETDEAPLSAAPHLATAPTRDAEITGADQHH